MLLQVNDVRQGYMGNIEIGLVSMVVWSASGKQLLVKNRWLVRQHVRIVRCGIEVGVSEVVFA